MTETDPFDTMLYLARGGDLTALRDLVHYIKVDARRSGWRSDDRRVTYALRNLLDAAPPGSPQQREIESLSDLPIYRRIKSDAPWTVSSAAPGVANLPPSATSSAWLRSRCSPPANS